MKTREYARRIRIARRTGCLLLLLAVTGLELWMVCHCGLQWFSRVDYSPSTEASLAIDYPVSNPMFPSW